MPETENRPEKPSYKSPLPKLVEFFRNSRDKWKGKHEKAKYQAKLLSNQVRYQKKRNAELKRQVKELEKRLEEEKKTP